MAKQAGGSALVQYGDTVVLVTATAAKEARENIDFFPLTCDYQEKTLAAGKIPGGFFKREGRQSEKEILNSRLIDRPLRPLGPVDPDGDHRREREQRQRTLQHEETAAERRVSRERDDRPPADLPE